jgi:hypothetical protein
MRLFLPQAHPNCAHIKLIVKKTCEKEGEKKTAQIGTNNRARGFNSGLLSRSQFASGRSCDRSTRSRFSVVFLGPRANAELVPKLHVALYASHAALPMATLQISPYANLTLTFELTLGWTTLFIGIWVRAPCLKKKKSNCQTKKIKIW